MRMRTVLILVLGMCLPSICGAEEFLQAPVLPGGKVLTSEDSRLQKAYDDVGYRQAVKYYEEALKEQQDVKFWERTAETCIEDHGSRPWHSITIEKTSTGAVTITIVRDSWTWIIGTLVLRFIGVFVVLCVLYAGMSISGAILSRFSKPVEAKR